MSLRFGTCCPDLDAGAFTEVAGDIATLLVADARWRLSRCPYGGVDLPGLVARDWFVVERLAGADQ